MTTKIDDFIKKVKSTAEEDFFTPRTFYHLSSSMFHEMCELLKEQEAVEPEWRKGTPFCGNCGHRFKKKNRNIDGINCPSCGRSVKWNG